MEKHHRVILQRNRENFVNNIHDIDTVVSELQANFLLTDYMVEEIQSKPTRTAKIRELLNILPRRGEEAFDLFYSVLVSDTVDEAAAADLLKPELKEKRIAARKQNLPFCPLNQEVESDEEPLPEDWPNKNPEEIQLKECKTSHISILKKFKLALENPVNDSIYPMTKPKRGICMIINNDEFNDTTKLGKRDGSDNDSAALTDTFENLKFEVDIKENITAEKMRNIVRYYSEINHSDYECFVMVIMSHGCRGNVYGTDGELMKISEIIDSFKTCTSLNKKPKLFFIQACQNDEVKDISAALEKLHISNNQRDGSGDPNVLTDFLVAMSTIPGAFSWRNTLFGSWFIQAIVFVLRKFAYRSDINDIMTKVNNLVQKGGGGGRQVSLYHTSFSKKLYLFPGWDTGNMA